MAGTLTVDLSTRDVGWACDVGKNRPEYGLMKLPGMKDLGKLYRAAYNGLEALVERLEPDRLVFCMALFRDAQTAAEALAGVQAQAILVAYDFQIEARKANEMQARKAVLGRGSFGLRDETTGNLVKGMGSKMAKAAVMKWCDDRGYPEGRPWFTHDCGDALVLLEYDRMVRYGRPLDGREICKEK